MFSILGTHTINGTNLEKFQNLRKIIYVQTFKNLQLLSVSKNSQTTQNVRKTRTISDFLLRLFILVASALHM